MNSKKILVVDDDAKTLKGIKGFLTRNGFTLMTVGSGRKALNSIGDFDPDLVILDIMMPDIDGFEVCRQIRQNNDVPVIFLSAKAEITSKILGFTLGGDDYITKPFYNEELLLRIKALLKRANSGSGAGPNVLNFSDLVINKAARIVEKSGRRLHLTPKEFSLLWLLASNHDMVLSREQLIRYIWKTDYYEDPGILNALIKRLREKVEDDPANPCYLKTVRGMGYRFESC